MKLHQLYQLDQTGNKICMQSLDGILLRAYFSFDIQMQAVEDSAHMEWLRYLLMSLLGNEKKFLLEAISKCLASRESDLVRACLTAVALLSLALSSLSEIGFQISAFSALFHQLKRKPWRRRDRTQNSCFIFPA